MKKEILIFITERRFSDDEELLITSVETEKKIKEVRNYKVRL